MTVKTTHIDTHGDKMKIYWRHDKIHIDGCFDGERIAWRGIYKAEQAREIAKRLSDLADLMDE